MTNLLERIKDFAKENDEILSVEIIPLSELSEDELEEFSEKEFKQSEYAILITVNRESYDLEGLLYELDILFVYTFFDFPILLAF